MNNGIKLLLLLMLAGLTGCAESDRQEATGKGAIRGLNASVAVPELGFLLEERLLSTADYKVISGSSQFDDLDYTVNFDYRFVGEVSTTRLLSVPFTMVKDMEHLFIYTGTLAAPASILWQRPLRVWDGSETVMKIEFGHLSPQLGEVDVYFADPGTLPVLGEARATLTNSNHSDAFELPAGDYELILTASGDPADILFASTVFTFLPATSYLAAVFDGDPSLTSPVSIRILLESGVSVELRNINVPPTLRAFHTAFGTGAFDLYRNNDFSAALISNVANNQLSLPVDVAPEESTFTFTQAGNIGTIVHEEDFAVTAGRHNTRFLNGEAGALLSVGISDDFRPLEDAAKFRLMHSAFNQQNVDLYVVKTGVDIADSLPRFIALPYLASTGYTFFAADSYDLYATTPLTKDILAGPFAVDLTDGDVVHFVLVDTADPNALELIKYDHRSVAAP